MILLRINCWILVQSFGFAANFNNFNNALINLFKLLLYGQCDQLVSTPIVQDVLELGIAKAEEAQGGSVVLGRMKGQVNFSHADSQLPPATVRALQLGNLVSPSHTATQRAWITS